MTATADTPKLLVVDDDRAFRISTAELLRQEGWTVQTAANAADAADALRAGRFDLVLLDLRMPGLDGTGLVRTLREWGVGIPILMISGFGTVDAAVTALHVGADDFLTKPVEPDVLIERVRRLLERRPAGALRSEPPPGGLVGRSAAIRMVHDAIRLVAPTDSTVLITGETGTGKELVAHAIHELSGRKTKSFIAINCASLAEGLLESELFGHVRGAFTGAVRDHPGVFRAAVGGTIFLDEIGDISAGLQHRLLRVLEEKELLPVGGVRPVHVDVRVIAATNRDLRAAVDEKRFRNDLFYRLNVFHIKLPPLRERSGDIPLLVEHFFEKKRTEDQPARPPCSPFAMRLLTSHDWPGNVRELFAALESARILAGGGRIEAQHLPAEVREPHDSADSDGTRYRGPARVDDERAAIIAALEQAEGVRSHAADLLGMGRTTLWRKIKHYGLD